jgi:hypothetical protein
MIHGSPADDDCISTWYMHMDVLKTGAVIVFDQGLAIAGAPFVWACSLASRSWEQRVCISAIQPCGPCLVCNVYIVCLRVHSWIMLLALPSVMPV